MGGGANNMNRPAVQGDSAKQTARAPFVFGIIFQQFTIRQAIQHVVQGKILRDHFLMRVNGKANLTRAKLFNNPRLDLA